MKYRHRMDEMILSFTQQNLNKNVCCIELKELAILDLIIHEEKMKGVD